MKGKAINVVASAVGLAVLVGVVFAAAAFFSPGQHFWVAGVAGSLFTVPLAIAAWNGSLWKNDKGHTQGPTSWREWIGLFCGASAVSALFVAIDLAVVNPGFSLLFTIGALSMAFIALPSAVRAWLLEWLSKRYSRRDNDA